MSPIEKKIISNFKSGNINLLYDEYYAALVMYAIKLLGERNDILAEDCVQNSIMKAWQKRKSFDNIHALKTFLYITIKNEIISIHRKNKAYQNYSSQNFEEYNFKDLIVEQEVKTMLYASVNKLPEKYKGVFELSFLYGLKNKEIAQQLDISESTVKKYKSRSLECIKKELSPELLGLILFFLAK